VSHSGYYDQAAMHADVRDGRHREAIGGLWDKIGDLQIGFLIEQGMQPGHRLLDVGCGSLRLGARAVEYLDADRYFGSDLNEILIRAGYEQELTEAQRAKVPWDHFGVNADFSFDFLSQSMDFAIAQSVFTHLPLNHLRRCLHKLAPHMAKGGRFFVTYFECLEGQDLFAPLAQPHGGITTYDYQDPYHYRLGDLAWTVDPAQWDFEPVGEWNHPRGQRMACFRRL
jgi:SAM-dependent methyltransferase